MNKGRDKLVLLDLRNEWTAFTRALTSQLNVFEEAKDKNIEEINTFSCIIILLLLIRSSISCNNLISICFLLRIRIV